MTCQRCAAKAIVHLTETTDGQVREVHLCRDCARKAGLPLDPPVDLGLDAVLEALILKNVGELVGAQARQTCPDCGLSFMEFRVQGRMGCPSDYQAFSESLQALLRHTHGASRHVGKRPTRIGAADGRLRLRALLRQAVEREDYEEAARLRDRLRMKETNA